MAQATLHGTLDSVQGMINGLCIEMGKALSASNKEGGRPLSSVSARLKVVMPTTLENYHAALDEFECDIIRAKSVIARDYEELRARRLALERPEPVVEEVELHEPIPIDVDMDVGASSFAHMGTQDSSITIVKDEQRHTNSPEKQAMHNLPESSKKESPQAMKEIKAQTSTPPSSGDAKGAESKPVGLGIDTQDITSAPGPDTADLQNSAIDSLFGADDKDTNDADLEFAMEFLADDTDNNNPQGNGQSQPQNSGFDLANFGNTAQGDFNMPSVNANNNTNSANANSNSNDTNKQEEDPFASLASIGAADGGAGDSMELDLADFGMAGGDDSVFDDMFFGDDNTNLGGGDMDHGEFDNAFFGIGD